MSGNLTVVGHGSEEKIEETTVDWSGRDAVTMAVVEAVASSAGVDATELRPLGEVVDPEALDSLFQPDGSPPAGHIEFEYEGHLIRVTARGELTVKPLR